MVLLGQPLRLVDEFLHVRLQFLGLSQGREDALVRDELRAHRLDQRLSVFRASVQLSELEPMSHLYKQAMDVIKIITFFRN